MLEPAGQEEKELELPQERNNFLLSVPASRFGTVEPVISTKPQEGQESHALESGSIRSVFGVCK
jgi:hypothetical protein